MHQEKPLLFLKESLGRSGRGLVLSHIESRVIESGVRLSHSSQSTQGIDKRETHVETVPCVSPEKISLRYSKFINVGLPCD